LGKNNKVLLKPKRSESRSQEMPLWIFIYFTVRPLVCTRGLDCIHMQYVKRPYFSCFPHTCLHETVSSIGSTACDFLSEGSQRIHTHTSSIEINFILIYDTVFARENTYLYTEEPLAFHFEMMERVMERKFIYFFHFTPLHSILSRTAACL